MLFFLLYAVLSTVGNFELQLYPYYKEGKEFIQDMISHLTVDKPIYKHWLEE